MKNESVNQTHCCITHVYPDAELRDTIYTEFFVESEANIEAAAVKGQGYFFTGYDLNFEQLDIISEGLADTYGPLLELQKNLDTFDDSTIIILDSLEVTESLRGKGLGSSVMKKIIQHFIDAICYTGEWIMLVKPYPLEEVHGQYENGIKDEEHRIIRFYKKLGFKRISDQDHYYLNFRHSSASPDGFTVL